MNSNPSLYRVPLKFGAVGAILLSIVLVILFYMGKHPMLIPIIMDFRLIAVPIFVVLAILEFRDFRNRRKLVFWQGMFIGFICYTTMGLGAGVFLLIFTFADQGFLSQFIEISTTQLVENKDQFIQSIGPEAYNANLAKLPSTTGFDLSADYFFKTIIVGLFFTIIISVILRRQPK